MSGVSLLFILAFALMGVLNGCGITDVIIKPVQKRINGAISAAVYTLIITVVINAMSASAVTSCVIVIGFMLPVYQSKKLDVSILAITTTIGCLLCTLVIPWHSNCVNPAAFLGVAPTDMIKVVFAPAVMTAVSFIYFIANRILANNGK